MIAMDCNTPQVGAYPLPPPCTSMDNRVYLPFAAMQQEQKTVCLPDNQCEILNVRTYINDVPVIETKDEGWYNEMWLSKEFYIDGVFYSVLNYGGVPDLVYLYDEDNPYQAYVVLYMDGEWFFLGVVEDTNA